MTTWTRKTLTDALVGQGFLIPTGVAGVFGRTGRFQAILSGFDAIVVERARAAGAEAVDFPPVVDREVIRRTSYMDSFPELCGSIHSYRQSRGSYLALADRVAEGGDWSEFLEPMPLTLCPAACYPLYPTCSGQLPEGGRHFDLASWIFRAEPSDDPARLQSFRMRENVRIAAPGEVLAWRDAWLEGASALLLELGLDATSVVAADPFFGRGGRLLAANQVEDELKFEIVVPITSSVEPTAVCSLNYHEDKFSSLFEIHMSDGTLAHTGCVGFGLERIALALVATHGTKVADWPGAVRARLSL